MAEFFLTVEAAIRGYHVYVDQWEAAVNTTVVFGRELGGNHFNERQNSVLIYCCHSVCISSR